MSTKQQSNTFFWFSLKKEWWGVWKCSSMVNSLYYSINVGGNRAVLVLCAILRVHQRREALTFSGRAVGQMPAYFKRETASIRRPSACTSSRTTTASERRKVPSHTKSSYHSYQWLKWSDKEGIKKRKQHWEGHSSRNLYIELHFNLN